MKRVSIETPFKPNTSNLDPRYTEAEHLRQNLVYARLCMLDSLKRNEAPYLSHLLYTQVWGESPEEREAGIKAGLEYVRASALVVLCCDLRVSGGMHAAREVALEANVPVTMRNLFGPLVDVRALLAGMRPPVFPFLAALEATVAAE